MTEEICKEFMKKTQYEFMGQSDQSQGLPPPPHELDYDKSQPIIDLPAPSRLIVDNINLRDAIENRKSVRNYSDEALTITELSWLLWCTQGVKKVTSRPVTLRNVPSAGARHAFETYCLVNNVEDIQPGLYRFLAVDHKLVPVNLEVGIADNLAKACLDQSHVKRSAVTFFWVVVVYRMYYRYQERGYRYLHLDAGHICQNLYLAAENIGAGVCAIGAFDDKKLNKILGLDGEEQFVIYLGTLGKKK